MPPSKESEADNNWSGPPYSYVSGRFPHPVTHPEGHSYGAEEELLRRVDSEEADAVFEEGVQLFDHGYYWESHEAWEAVWRVALDPHRRLVQGLIKIAAAAVKGREMRPRGVERHLARAAELLDVGGDIHWMRVDWPQLRGELAELRENASILLSDSDEPVVITIPFTIPRRIPSGE